ncbi:MAG: ABC transporter substrate-binding protein, partial [Rhizobium sp.]|nr:ABC transporter substrate-binding protein [Rhizobium sp.]
MTDALLAARPNLLRSLALGLAATVAVILSGPALAAQKDLTLGMTIEPAGLDPTIAAPVAIGQVTWQNIFEGLVTIDRDGKIKPQLAKSWEISEDG